MYNAGEDYEKTGYLDDSFKLFHLKDCQTKDYSFHYHDFIKVLLFLSGDVHYFIEGKSYKLEPYDIVLVDAGEVHRPIINSDSPYERIILYISPEFLAAYNREKYSLNTCFQKAKQENSNVLRIASGSKHKLYQLCAKLETSLLNEEFADELYSHTLLLEFLIHLNRVSLSGSVSYIETDFSNPKILEIIHYINDNLNSDLSIEALSRKFFISRRYLMYTFQKETGYSIGKYINAKRLFLAREKIQNGMPITQACFSSGFHHYSTFTRSYFRMFQEKPSSLKKDTK